MAMKVHSLPDFAYKISDSQVRRDNAAILFSWALATGWAKMGRAAFGLV